MDKSSRIVVVDDNATNDPFYPELMARLRTDLFPEPEIILLDADSLHPEPKLTVEKIRQARPDLILIDVVLHEGGGRPDLVLCDWLVREIRVDSNLRGIPLIYVSRYFCGHYPVPVQWRRWAFAKQALISDEEAWSSFIEILRNLSGVARQQGALGSLPRALMSNGSSV